MNPCQIRLFALFVEKSKKLVMMYARIAEQSSRSGLKATEEDNRSMITAKLSFRFGKRVF